MSKIPKNTYKFMFNTEDSAARFLKIANEHTGTNFAQHPLLGDGSAERDKKTVLVTGTKSILFDVSTISYLEGVAEGLAGALVN